MSKNESNVQNKEELETLFLEILEMRNVLHEMSQQLVRIERRVRITLPKSEHRLSLRRQKIKLDEATAKREVEKLKESVKNGVQIEDELRKMSVKNELAMIARELGMTNTALPPKNDLIRRISSRVRQAVSVYSSISEALREPEDPHSDHQLPIDTPKHRVS